MKEESLTALAVGCMPGFSPKLFFPFTTLCFSLNRKEKKKSMM